MNPNPKFNPPTHTQLTCEYVNLNEHYENNQNIMMSKVHFTGRQNHLRCCNFPYNSYSRIDSRLQADLNLALSVSVSQCLSVCCLSSQIDVVILMCVCRSYHSRIGPPDKAISIAALTVLAVCVYRVYRLVVYRLSPQSVSISV